MNDDSIIRQRIAGRSVRAIAKAQGTTAAAVNEVIDRWAASTVQPVHDSQPDARGAATLPLLAPASAHWVYSAGAGSGKSRQG